MKGTTIAIIVAGTIVLGSIMIFGRGGRGGPNISSAPAGNVSVADGEQIVSIGVRGGYYPGLSQAKAGLPTVLRMQTNGTYDCSSAVSIPSLGIYRTLPPSGSSDIEVPAQPSGARLLGTCAMGMYRFEVDFNG